MENKGISGRAAPRKARKPVGFMQSCADNVVCWMSSTGGEDNVVHQGVQRSSAVKSPEISYSYVICMLSARCPHFIRTLSVARFGETSPLMYFPLKEQTALLTNEKTFEVVEYVLTSLVLT